MQNSEDRISLRHQKKGILMAPPLQAGKGLVKGKQNEPATQNFGYLP